MKVILKKDVAKIGKAGEVVNVADGYARNFLIARGLGDEATEGKIRDLAEKSKTAKIKDDKNRAAAAESKKKIDGKVVRVEANASETGKLFGAVTTAKIADALKEQLGVAADKKDIKTDAIKQTGDYKAKVKLYAGVEAEIVVRVEAERA